MSEAWCELCDLGPMSAAELAEHYRTVHALKPGETGTPAVRYPPKPRRVANRRVDKVTYPACEVCGSPLIDDEEGVCQFCA